MATVAMVNALTQIVIDGGPSEMDILEALHFNRKKILAFKVIKPGTPESICIYLNTVFPTRAPHEFFLVGLWLASAELSKETDMRHQVVVGYNTRSRRGSVYELEHVTDLFQLIDHPRLPFSLRD